MKLNKYNPSHYVVFILMCLSFFTALTLFLIIKKRKNYISLYGHNLDGNLKIFYSHFQRNNEEVYYLTIKYSKYKFLKKKNFNVLYALYPSHYLHFLNSKYIISSHDLHFHTFIRKIAMIKTFYCGHGFRTSHVKNNNKYNKKLEKFHELWLFSNYEKYIYLNECFYKKDNIFVTGYPRIDCLNFQNKENNTKFKDYLNGKQIVIVALTEKNKNKNIFSINNINFLKNLEKLAENLNLEIIIKSHPQFKIKKTSKLYISNSKSLNFFDIFETFSFDEILFNSEFLISDWSSIIIDYLVFQKPIYLLSNNKPTNFPYTEVMEKFDLLRYKDFESLERQLSTFNNRLNLLHVGNIYTEIFNNKYHKDNLNRCLKRLKQN